MTAPPPPLVCRWDGESFIPNRPKLADKHFVVGMDYPLIVHEERSTNSHKHYFAAIHECWKNLPETLADEYSTSEKLRKHALIKAGYADKQSIVCSNRTEALRLAAFIRPIDDYAIVTVNGTVVTRYTAQSQSARAMGGKVFQDSKQAVLDIVSAMIGVTPDALSSNTAQAA